MFPSNFTFATESSSSGLVSLIEQMCEVSFPPISHCPQRFIITIPEVKFDDKVFELHAPLTLDLYNEDGVWNCQDEAGMIQSFGDSQACAVHSFCEDFAVLWAHIAEAPDSDLTPDAQRLKSFLRSVVKAVRTE